MFVHTLHNLLEGDQVPTHRFLMSYTGVIIELFMALSVPFLSGRVYGPVTGIVQAGRYQAMAAQSDQDHVQQ